MKRLHEELGDDSYGAVGFSYDQGQGQQAYQRKHRYGIMSLDKKCGFSVLQVPIF